MSDDDADLPPMPDLGGEPWRGTRMTMLLRARARMPVGAGAEYNLLTNEVVNGFVEALEATPLADAVAQWCKDLGLPRPGPLRRGEGNSRRRKLTATSRDERHQVDWAVDVHRLDSSAGKQPELVVTIDVAASLILGPAPTAHSHVLNMVLSTGVDAGGESNFPTLGHDWPPMLKTTLRALLDGLLTTLTDRNLIRRLGDFAGAGDDRPRLVSLKWRAVHHSGVDLNMRPDLDSFDEVKRRELVEYWLVQFELDTGQSGPFDAED